MTTTIERATDITPAPAWGAAHQPHVGQHRARTLRDLRASDLRKGAGSELPELILAKLASLDTTGFTERQLTKRARLLLELLRDTLGGRYPDLSLPAFADIVLAMDYFVAVHDEIPDTLPGGLADDLRKFDETIATHRGEIEAYRRWREGG